MTISHQQLNNNNKKETPLSHELERTASNDTFVFGLPACLGVNVGRAKQHKCACASTGGLKGGVGAGAPLLDPPPPSYH